MRCRVTPWRASVVVRTGGGSPPLPGEISLAHRGVLFLDELPEFDRRVLEALREPLETGRVTISRAARQAEFPAFFQLIAAMNPCPCGHLGDPAHACRCTLEQVQRYRARISGPMLDRIDLQVMVPPVSAETLSSDAVAAESSRDVARRVSEVWEVQRGRQGVCNARLGIRGLREHCVLDPRGLDILQRAARRLAFSARVYHRFQRLARTIADLEGAERIASRHVAEAIQLRRFEA